MGLANLVSSNQAVRERMVVDVGGYEGIVLLTKLV